MDNSVEKAETVKDAGGDAKPVRAEQPSIFPQVA
jgi:hypothetical protein